MWLQEQISVFTVLKKSGKRRLVIDARMSNGWFDSLEAVDLATGMAFSTIDRDGPEPVVLGQVDIANAFYAIELPSELRQYFGLPSVFAKEVGVTEINGSLLYPRIASFHVSRSSHRGWT